MPVDTFCSYWTYFYTLPALLIQVSSQIIFINTPPYTSENTSLLYSEAAKQSFRMNAYMNNVLVLSREFPVLACLITAGIAATLYVLFAVVLPAIRMDWYLSKFPTMRGSLPLLGHALLLVGPAPWRKMANWSMFPERNAPNIKKTDAQSVSRLVAFNVAGMRVVYINHPQLLKRVLLSHQRNYRKALRAAYKHFLCLLGTGLVTSEDEQWKKGRLLLSHAMRIDILVDIPEMTMKAVNRIMERLDHVDKTKPYVDLAEEFRHMTLQVIGESVLSFAPEETDLIFPALYLPIVHECNKRVWAPWRAFMPFLTGFRERSYCLHELNRVLSEIIRSRWAQRSDRKGKPDILALCMSQIEKIDEKVILELRDDVKTMLLAGHETSAALLTFATYETIRHPEIRRRVIDEAKKLYDPQNCKQTIQTPYGERGIPSVDQVRELIWTPAVLRETLRRHSVVPLVMRYAAKDEVWPAAETGLEKDLSIPAGCTIAVGIEGVHNNPDVWDNPDQFDPERFVDAEIANNTNTLNSNRSNHYSKRIDPYAFIPFINGPRNCLGQHLSLVETQVALSYLFYNWDLNLYREPDMYHDDKTWEEEVGRHHDFIIPQVPHDGLKVYGTPTRM